MVYAMKNCFVLLVVLAAACTPQPMVQNLDSVGSPPPALGDDIIPLALKKQGWLIFFSNDLHEEYLWSCKEMYYTLLTAEGGRKINGILCKDERFVTPEGVRVGQTMDDVKRLTGGEYRTMRGFGYWIPLESGWNAVFFQGESAAGGPLADDAKVKLVAKSSHLQPAQL